MSTIRERLPRYLFPFVSVVKSRLEHCTHTSARRPSTDVTFLLCDVTRAGLEMRHDLLVAVLQGVCV
jgi:hypothetical protein